MQKAALWIPYVDLRSVFSSRNNFSAGVVVLWLWSVWYKDTLFITKREEIANWLVVIFGNFHTVR